MNWEEHTTRCIHIKRDGKRCSNECEAGKYVCEHHEIGLDDFVADPIKTVAMYRRYFPKDHNPACDRKGQNDCDCPDRGFGKLLGLTLQRAADTSLKRTPEFKEAFHHEMIWKTNMIRDYYYSIDESNLWLGMPNPKWRQFRFFVYDRNAQRVIVKKVKDNITNKTTLLKHLRNYAPLHCYYTTAQWLDPQNIGPDPNSKSGFSKYKRQHNSRSYQNVDNVFIAQEMYFDIDYEMETFQQAAAETQRLALFYEQVDTGCKKDVRFVFSGGKGFHMIDYGWDLATHLGGGMNAQAAIEKRAQQMNKRTKATMGVSWARQDLSRSIKKRLIRDIRKAGILLDYEVTVDPRRIIRVPGTIHGKRGRVCRVIDEAELENFNPGPTLW